MKKTVIITLLALVSIASSTIAFVQYQRANDLSIKFESQKKIAEQMADQVEIQKELVREQEAIAANAAVIAMEQAEHARAEAERRAKQ